jgi:sec-independent protein translocase protein TatB
VFDLSITKILVLAVIALIVFGPNELPKVASQAGRMLRDLRRIAEGAKADLRDGLGPEFENFDFDDLNPKTFVRKHLFDETEQQALFDQFKASTDLTTEPVPAVVAGQQSGNGNGASNGAGNGNGNGVSSGARTTIRDGEEPPFDFEAT